MTTSVTVTTSADEVLTAELWPLYDDVFGDQPSRNTWREAVWDRHVARAGFRLALARRDGALVGFAYGYTGERGQWWTDTVAEVLGPDLAQQWLGGHFELVSIGVRSEVRARGVGDQLLAALCHELPHQRWLLATTADARDPARRLYARHGWVVLGPGIGEGTVVMGRLA